MPGLIGAGIAAPLIATGVGAPLGLLAGSLAGGAAQGIGKATGDKSFNAKTTNDLVEALGGDRDSFLQNLGVGIIADPMTYAGGLGMASKAAKAAQAVGKTKPAFSGMMQARRGFDVLKDVGPNLGEIGRVIGRSGNEGKWSPVANSLISEAPAGVQGWFEPGDRVAAVLKGADPRTGRHEIVHGIIDSAARSGDYANLPLLMKSPAALKSGFYRGSTPVKSFRMGAADIMDELAAQTLENKGTWNQLKGAADFLFARPFGGNSYVRSGYAKEFANTSPEAAALYRAIGYSPYVAGGGALAGGGVYGASQLLGE